MVVKRVSTPIGNHTLINAVGMIVINKYRVIPMLVLRNLILLRRLGPLHVDHQAVAILAVMSLIILRLAAMVRVVNHLSSIVNLLCITRVVMVNPLLATVAMVVVVQESSHQLVDRAIQ